MKMAKRTWTLLALSVALPLTVSHASSDGLRWKVEEVQIQTAPVSAPNFKSIKNTQARKQAFVDFLRPSYEQVARGILSQRKQLQQLKQQLEAGILLSDEQQSWLAHLAEQYRLTNISADQQGIERLLVRVDILPPELVLSQAATESGWGTSRSAREANNFFGHFCYNQACGNSPYRSGGSRMMVFASPTQAVQAYMRNLNTHPAYNKVRQLRADMRAEVKPLDAVVLAKGLTRYSTLGNGYVNKIQGMIRTNKNYWQRPNQSNP